MRRVGCYVDGFNLYHAVHDLQKPHLKWLDLAALAGSLCRPNEVVVKVAYFSAYATWRADAYARHRAYVAALDHRGVECHLSRFLEKDAQCNMCGARWKRHEEKETDVHFSLMLLEDAIDNVFDRAIIISADSDLVPPVRAIRRRLPRKEVFVATPPGRHAMARDLLGVCNSGIALTPGRLAGCLFPERVIDAEGAVVAVRPADYNPPV